MSRINLSSAFVDLTLEDARFTRSLAQTERRLTQFQRRFSRGSSRLTLDDTAFNRTITRAQRRLAVFQRTQRISAARQPIEYQRSGRRAGGGVNLSLGGGAGSGKELLKGATVIAAGWATVRMYKAIFTATIDNEESQTKLRAALRATGNEVENNARRINALADTMRDNLNVDDDTTRQLAAYGINLGVTTDKIDEMVKAAIGLAEATGDDAASAMVKLVKANQGSFTALQRQLPLLAKMGTAEQKLAYVQKIAKQGLQQRAEQMHNLGGATKQLALATNELAENIGEALSPALIKVTKLATEGVKALQAWQNTGNAPVKGFKAVEVLRTKEMALKDKALAQARNAALPVSYVAPFSALAQAARENKRTDDPLGRDFLKRQSFERQLAEGSPERARARERTYRAALLMNGEGSLTQGMLIEAYARDRDRIKREKSSMTAAEVERRSEGREGFFAEKIAAERKAAKSAPDMKVYVEKGIVVTEGLTKVLGALSTNMPKLIEAVNKPATFK